MKKSQKIRLGKFPLSSVLDYLYEKDGIIYPIKGEIIYTAQGKSWRVNMSSKRYKIFLKSKRCFVCGIKGLYLILEHQTDNPLDRAHFNMYGEDPVTHGEILFTVDHMIPKSMGGDNTHDNIVTMCQPCNGHKSDTIFSKDDLIQGVLSLRIEAIQRKLDRYKSAHEEYLNLNLPKENIEKNIRRMKSAQARLQWLEQVYKKRVGARND